MVCIWMLALLALAFISFSGSTVEAYKDIVTILQAIVLGWLIFIVAAGSLLLLRFIHDKAKS